MWHRDLLRLAALAALLAAAAAQPLTVLWVPGGGYASSHLGGDAGAVVHVRLDANYAVTGFDVGDITWPEYALNSTAAVSLASLDEGAGLQWLLSFTPNVTGDIALTVLASGGIYAAGPAVYLLADSNFTLPFELRPTFTACGSTLTHAGPGYETHVCVSWNDAVTGFSVDDVVVYPVDGVTGLSVVTTGARSYWVQYTPSYHGPLGFTIAPHVAPDSSPVGVVSGTQLAAASSVNTTFAFLFTTKDAPGTHDGTHPFSVTFHFNVADGLSVDGVVVPYVSSGSGSVTGWACGSGATCTATVTPSAPYYGSIVLTAGAGVVVWDGSGEDPNAPTPSAAIGTTPVPYAPPAVISTSEDHVLAGGLFTVSVAWVANVTGFTPSGCLNATGATFVQDSVTQTTPARVWTMSYTAQDVPMASFALLRNCTRFLAGGDWTDNAISAAVTLPRAECVITGRTLFDGSTTPVSLSLDCSALASATPAADSFVITMASFTSAVHASEDDATLFTLTLTPDGSGGDIGVAVAHHGIAIAAGGFFPPTPAPAAHTLTAMPLLEVELVPDFALVSADAVVSLTINFGVPIDTGSWSLGADLSTADPNVCVLSQVSLTPTAAVVSVTMLLGNNCVVTLASGALDAAGSAGGVHNGASSTTLTYMPDFGATLSVGGGQSVHGGTTASFVLALTPADLIVPSSFVVGDVTVTGPCSLYGLVVANDAASVRVGVTGDADCTFSVAAGALVAAGTGGTVENAASNSVSVTYVAPFEVGVAAAGGVTKHGGANVTFAVAFVFGVPAASASFNASSLVCTGCTVGSLALAGNGLSGTGVVTASGAVSAVLRIRAGGVSAVGSAGSVLNLGSSDLTVTYAGAFSAALTSEAAHHGGAGRLIYAHVAFGTPVAADSVVLGGLEVTGGTPSAFACDASPCNAATFTVTPSGTGTLHLTVRASQLAAAHSAGVFNLISATVDVTYEAAFSVALVRIGTGGGVHYGVNSAPMSVRLTLAAAIVAESLSAGDFIATGCDVSFASSDDNSTTWELAPSGFGVCSVRLGADTVNATDSNNGVHNVASNTLTYTYGVPLNITSASISSVLHGANETGTVTFGFDADIDCTGVDWDVLTMTGCCGWIGEATCTSRALVASYATCAGDCVASLGAGRIFLAGSGGSVSTAGSALLYAYNFALVSSSVSHGVHGGPAGGPIVFRFFYAGRAPDGGATNLARYSLTGGSGSASIDSDAAAFVVTVTPSDSATALVVSLTAGIAPAGHASLGLGGATSPLTVPYSRVTITLPAVTHDGTPGSAFNASITFAGLAPDETCTAAVLAAALVVSGGASACTVTTGSGLGPYTLHVVPNAAANVSITLPDGALDALDAPTPGATFRGAASPGSVQYAFISLHLGTGGNAYHHGSSTTSAVTLTWTASTTLHGVGGAAVHLSTGGSVVSMSSDGTLVVLPDDAVTDDLVVWTTGDGVLTVDSGAPLAASAHVTIPYAPRAVLYPTAAHHHSNVTQFRLVGSQALGGVAGADLSCTGSSGSHSVAAGPGEAWTFSVTPAGSGAVACYVTAGSVYETATGRSVVSAAASNTVSTPFALFLDAVASAARHDGTAFTISFTWSANAQMEDHVITVDHGTAGTPYCVGHVCTVRITPSGAQNLTWTLPRDAAELV